MGHDMDRGSLLSDTSLYVCVEPLTRTAPIPAGTLTASLALVPRVRQVVSGVRSSYPRLSSLQQSDVLSPLSKG